MTNQTQLQQLIELSSKLSETIRNYFRTATKTAQNFLQKYLGSGSSRFIDDDGVLLNLLWV
jgi:hypothetical protein